jgi:hypothetical protein
MYREETFGPILMVETVSSAEEALTLPRWWSVRKTSKWTCPSGDLRAINDAR